LDARESAFDIAVWERRSWRCTAASALIRDRMTGAHYHYLRMPRAGIDRRQWRRQKMRRPQPSSSRRSMQIRAMRRW